MINLAYKYYNQNNYANVHYPSPDLPNATLESGGCGVVSSAMIVENLTGKVTDPKDMAAYAIKKGARVSGGTDLNVMAKAISVDYGLIFTTTSDENLLLNHLKAGGMAIANVGGDRPGYVGVFSDGGHYIVAAGLTDDGKIIVLDPGYYVGKFNKAGRAGKVTISGNYCICDITVLAKDTENRSPSYWLFSKKGEDEDMLTPVKIMIDGKPLSNGYVSKVDGKDTSFAPVKALAEALGAKVSWDAATSTVIVKKGN